MIRRPASLIWYASCVSLLFVWAAAALGFVAAAGAQAQGLPCGPRAEIVAALGAKYGEGRLGLGMAGDSGVIEVYRSIETGTFTVLLTLPTGAACIISAGNAWSDVNEAPVAPIPGRHS